MVPVEAPGAEALYLTWDDCWLGAGSSSASFDCITNKGENRLYAAFTLPVPVDSVIGVEAVIDLQTAAGTLPDWWQVGAGGCRGGSLTATLDFAGLTACVNPWGASGSALIQTFDPGQPNGPSQARIRAVAFVLPDSHRTLDDTTPYFALGLVLDHERSEGGLQCTGCNVAACLVLNSIVVRTISGGAGDLYLQTPGAGNGNWATWQSGGADCSAVPVRRQTWGRVKQLYR